MVRLTLLLLRPQANMLHSIEYKPSCALMHMPTFPVIKPVANKTLSEWHGF